jgi:hypothetical protein
MKKTEQANDLEKREEKSYQNLRQIEVLRNILCRISFIRKVRAQQKKRPPSLSAL